MHFGRNRGVGGQRESVGPPHPLSLITAPLETERKQADGSRIEIDKQDNEIKWKHGGLRALKRPIKITKIMIQKELRGRSSSFFNFRHLFPGR